MEFISAVKETLDDRPAVTENGMAGYKTSGKALLDLNFSVASLRGKSEDEIYRRFLGAFLEDRMTAMKWLFFARDVRGGLGERRLFRSIITNLARDYGEYVLPLVSLIPEYGRADDWWPLLDTPMAEKVKRLTRKQLSEDLAAERAGKGISLLAKWMPSANASSRRTRRYAKTLAKYLRWSDRTYRRTLSKLRKKLDVVERRMSSRAWDEIRYEAVPSRANLVYSKAFLRNDKERREAFLESLKKGKATINAGTLFPHDIVNRYCQDGHYVSPTTDVTLEELWKALPDPVRGCGNTIVVADGSGSMFQSIGSGGVTALDVANALAIYFAERSSGQFKDQYITFSRHPQLVNLSHAKTLREKLVIATRHNEVDSTNIEAVFTLILETAVKFHMRQDEIPQNVLIISDMEFDCCAGCNEFFIYMPHYIGVRLFDAIAARYQEAGYKLPRLIFWNVNSRTNVVPIRQNDLGIALVSGFSVHIARMVMSNKLDPYECLLEMLNEKRYDPVGKALSDFIEKKA